MSELTKYEKLVKLQPVDFVPEIQLYLCDTAHHIVYPDRYPCWAYAWVGGKALARYILDHPQLVEGKTIIDMAAGSGIAAIAAKMAGAARVIAVDDYTPRCTYLVLPTITFAYVTIVVPHHSSKFILKHSINNASIITKFRFIFQ